jgi:uncharacterized damage-inducible protein DinB
MNQRDFAQIWDQLRQKYGVYLRLLEAIPDDQLHAHPIPGWRSFAELVAHVSGTIIRDMATGIAKGAITADESKEAGVAAGFKTTKDMVAFARQCWSTADAAAKKIGDAELAAIVPTPWGFSAPGFVEVGIQGDEFLHHRGQLYAFARHFGVQPPFMWSFGENEAGFKPAT